MKKLSLIALLLTSAACGDKDGTTPDDSTSTTDDSTTDDSTTDDSTTDDTSTGALPTCEDTFAACGGDPTGSWTFTEACYVSTRPTECAEARWTIKTTQTGGDIGDEVFAFVPAISFRPSAQTVLRFNYRYTRQRDLLKNPAVRSAGFQLGLTSYF